MQVSIEQGDDAPTLQVLETDRLDSLSVRVGAGVTSEHTVQALSGLGRVDDQHVWLDIDALRDLAGIGQPPAWRAKFDGMIAYADTRGWVEGPAVRAHIES